MEKLKKILTPKNLLALGLLVLAVILRFIPHIPNFAPVTALALFAGVYFGGASAYLLPLAVMFISDIFLGFHSTMLFVYGSLLLTVAIGQFVKKKKNPATILGGTIAGSILFFIITNFGVWLTTNWYAPDLAGLIRCYYMAIPFFRNSVTGDIFYAIMLFGAYELAVFVIHKSELLPNFDPPMAGKRFPLRRRRKREKSA